jgi:hypothetical protein
MTDRDITAASDTFCDCYDSHTAGGQIRFRPEVIQQGIAPWRMLAASDRAMRAKFHRNGWPDPHIGRIRVLADMVEWTYGVVEQ